MNGLIGSRNNNFSGDATGISNNGIILLRGTITNVTSLNRKNWMIHSLYVTNNKCHCKKLITTELSNSNGHNEYAHYMMGLVLRDEGKIQESLRHFKKCRFLNPMDSKNFREIGRSLFLLGKYNLAIESFLNAEKLSRTLDWNIYHCLGVSYMKIRQVDKAKEYLMRAVSLGKSEQSFASLSKLYLMVQDFSSALDVYTFALKRYPSNTDLSINLALVYMRTNDYKEAFNQLGNTLGNNPINIEALFTFAAETQRHGEYEVSISKYKLAAQIAFDTPELWNNIGMCFFGKRKYVAAISCLKRANYLSPLNWLTLFNLGLLHLNTGQDASAVVFLSTAAKINRRHSNTFVSLAHALVHIGDNENAKESFEEALRVNCNDIEGILGYSKFLYTTLCDIKSARELFTRYEDAVKGLGAVHPELLDFVRLVKEELEEQCTSSTAVLSTTSARVSLPNGQHSS